MVKWKSLTSFWALFKKKTVLNQNHFFHAKEQLPVVFQGFALHGLEAAESLQIAHLLCKKTQFAKLIKIC